MKNSTGFKNFPYLLNSKTWYSTQHKISAYQYKGWMNSWLGEVNQHKYYCVHILFGRWSPTLHPGKSLPSHHKVAVGTRPVCRGSFFLAFCYSTDVESEKWHMPTSVYMMCRYGNLPLILVLGRQRWEPQSNLDSKTSLYNIRGLGVQSESCLRN